MQSSPWKARRSKNQGCNGIVGRTVAFCRLPFGADRPRKPMARPTGSYFLKVEGGRSDRPCAVYLWLFAALEIALSRGLNDFSRFGRTAPSAHLCDLPLQFLVDRKKMLDLADANEGNTSSNFFAPGRTAGCGPPPPECSGQAPVLIQHFQHSDRPDGDRVLPESSVRRPVSAHPAGRPSSALVYRCTEP